MSSTNPYLTGDEDADLFEDTSSNNNSAGSEIFGPNGERLPKDLADALMQYIGDGSASLHSSSIPSFVFVISDLISFYGQILNSGYNTPILSALCDVVNKMSEGLLDLYIDLHKARYDITIIHTIREYSSLVFDAMTKSVGGTEEFVQVDLMLKNFHEYLDWKMAILIKDYEDSCKSIGIEVEKDLLDYGLVKDKASLLIYKSSSVLNALKLMSEQREKSLDGADSNS